MIIVRLSVGTGEILLTADQTDQEEEMTAQHDDSSETEPSLLRQPSLIILRTI